MASFCILHWRLILHWDCNVELPPNENNVFQYHDIIKIFEEACGQDLSQFRIAPDRVNSRVDSKIRGHWQTPFAASTFVEYTYFCSQVHGLMGYVKTALGDR
jgi:hypothetical protein